MTPVLFINKDSKTQGNVAKHYPVLVEDDITEFLHLSLHIA